MLQITEDLRIHLMSIKGANKKLRTKVENMSANITGVEDRFNVRLTTSDRQRDDSLRVVTESLNRLTAAVQRLEARDATPR
jgi:archaellum component FlaC